MIEQLHHAGAVLAGKKVLIVDDDIRNIFAMTSMLEPYKMQILSAETGHGAIEMLQDTPDMDVVLNAATLSQIEEVSTLSASAQLPPAVPDSDAPQPRIGASISGQESDLGNVRASFIAAARRASRTGGLAGTPDDPEKIEPAQGDDPPSIIEQIRRTLGGARRPFLFSVALLGCPQEHPRFSPARKYR